MPVIILIGHGSADIYRKAMNPGAFDYVSKPISMLELNLVVKAALQRTEAYGSKSTDTH